MSDERQFLDMRAGLIERGLICGKTLQLTPAGNARVTEMIAELTTAPPPQGLAPGDQRVRWVPMRERWAARRREPVNA